MDKKAKKSLWTFILGILQLIVGIGKSHVDKYTGDKGDAERPSEE